MSKRKIKSRDSLCTVKKTFMVSPKMDLAIQEIEDEKDICTSAAIRYLCKIGLEAWKMGQEYKKTLSY